MGKLLQLMQLSNRVMNQCGKISEYYGAAEPPVRYGEVLPQLSVKEIETKGKRSNGSFQT